MIREGIRYSVVMTLVMNRAEKPLLQRFVYALSFRVLIRGRMAKIQVYVNDNVSEKINAIAVQRRAEGAKEKDISYSSIASMLLELGLRVYEAQLERKESGFNQMAFNKALLESVIKTQFSVNKVMGIECLSPHVKDDPRWQWKSMVQNIQDDVQEVMIRFFPDDNSED